jgi:hypothetical protein
MALVCYFPSRRGFPPVKPGDYSKTNLLRKLIKPRQTRRCRRRIRDLSRIYPGCRCRCAGCRVLRGRSQQQSEINGNFTAHRDENQVRDENCGENDVALGHLYYPAWPNTREARSAADVADTNPLQQVRACDCTERDCCRGNRESVCCGASTNAIA